MDRQLSRDDEASLVLDFVSGIESVPFLSAFYNISEEHVETIIDYHINKAVRAIATQARANGEFSELTEVDEEAIRQQYTTDVGTTVSSLAKQFNVEEEKILLVLLRMGAIENETYVYADPERRLSRRKAFELINLCANNREITAQDLLDRYGISMTYLGKLLRIYGDFGLFRKYRKPSPESVAVARTSMAIPTMPRRKVPEFDVTQWAKDPSELSSADAHIIHQTYINSYNNGSLYFNKSTKAIKSEPVRARRIEAIQAVYPTLSVEDIRTISKKVEELDHLKRRSPRISSFAKPALLNEAESQLLLISYILGAESLIELSDRMVLPIKIIVKTLVSTFASLLESDKQFVVEYQAALKLGAELEYSPRLYQYKPGPVRKHSDDVRAEIVRRAKTDPNVGLTTLARQFSVTTQTIAAILDKAGFKRKFSVLTAEAVDDALMRFIVQGVSSLELSFELNVNANTLRNQMKRAFYYDIEASVRESSSLGYPMVL